MRNKAPLAMMEQLVMVLVFALAATVCLQVFVFSDQMSRKNELIDCAVLAAQSTAETIKHTKGDCGKAAQMLGGSWDGTTWRLHFRRNGTLAEPNGDSDFCISVSVSDSDQPLLGTAEVTAEIPDGDVLFVIPIAWQEVDSYAQ